jgi:hypothetical protein
MRGKDHFYKKKIISGFTLPRYVMIRSAFQMLNVQVLGQIGLIECENCLNISLYTGKLLSLL